MNVINQEIFLRKLKQHWFFIAATVMICGDWIVVRTQGVDRPRLMEAAVLGDLALIMPLLYFVCYRSKGKAAIIRACALSCSAIWLCGYIIPQAHHYLLNSLSWMRYLGMAVLTVLEIKLILMLWRTIFKSNLSAEDVATEVAAKADMPLWVARLMGLEARFWRSIWLTLKRLTGRGDQ